VIWTDIHSKNIEMLWVPMYRKVENHQNSVELLLLWEIIHDGHRNDFFVSMDTNHLMDYKSMSMFAAFVNMFVNIIRRSAWIITRKVDRWPWRKQYIQIECEEMRRRKYILKQCWNKTFFRLFFRKFREHGKKYYLSTFEFGPRHIPNSSPLRKFCVKKIIDKKMMFFSFEKLC